MCLSPSLRLSTTVFFLEEEEEERFRRRIWRRRGKNFDDKIIWLDRLTLF